MTELENIPALIVQLVTDYETDDVVPVQFFSGWNITYDIGDKKAEIEVALTSDGRAVTVCPPAFADQEVSTQGVSETEIEIVVLVAVNSGVSSANILQAVRYVFSAVLEYGEDEEAFRCADMPFRLLLADEGLVTYALTFRKQVALS